eukprot:GGOE01006491.1.p1 GENE.GGOE01006491.1~~GGOE01006491.1.p1  ORF type:complete len:329 (-),score=24.14 GGOE01006491.1:933-1772(-)
MKQLTNVKTSCAALEYDLDPEHEILSRSVIRKVDSLIEKLPTDADTLKELFTSCCAECSCCVCEVSLQLLNVLDPWLIYGTKDCGHVIAHLAKRLFEYALRGLQFSVAAAKLVKSIHDEQVTKLREAKELKSKPHSIRRVVLNLVQSRFYLQPLRPEDEARHHEGSINNVVLIGQLLLHDLLVDSAVYESLVELLRPRNRPDSLSHRFEMACHLLSVAGQRLDQGACMDQYYHYMQRLKQSLEVSQVLRTLFDGIVADRTAWLQSVQPTPQTTADPAKP